MASYLEEVDLNRSIAEVQDDGALGSKPEAEVRQPGQFITFTARNVGTSFQEMLTHVVAEIFQ